MYKHYEEVCNLRLKSILRVNAHFNHVEDERHFKDLIHCHLMGMYIIQKVDI